MIKIYLPLDSHSGMNVILAQNINAMEVYIGSMRRYLGSSLREHKKDIKNGKLTTALARRFYKASLVI